MFGPLSLFLFVLGRPITRLGSMIMALFFLISILDLHDM